MADAGEEATPTPGGLVPDAVPGAPGGYGWLLRLLSGSRLVMAVAVLGLIVSAFTLIAYAGLVVAKTVLETVTGDELSQTGAKRLSVAFVELADVFLLGSVLLIVALGLYELFIDPRLPVPPWLRVNNLDELKGKLIGVILVLLAVGFLTRVVEWDGSAEILPLGLAVAAVVAAFAVYAFLADGPAGKEGTDGKQGRSDVGGDGEAGG